MKENYTLTKEHLSKTFVSQFSIKLKEARKYTDTIIGFITDTLAKEHNVKIRLFGTFKVNQKNARIGRNPKTKVEVVIKPHKVIRLRISPSLKKRIESNIDSLPFHQ